MSLYPDHPVVQCEVPDGEVELAMGPAALTGFQSWLEAGPPRHRSRSCDRAVRPTGARRRATGGPVFVLNGLGFA